MKEIFNKQTKRMAFKRKDPERRKIVVKIILWKKETLSIIDYL
jgi:hypothetical protein